MRALIDFHQGDLLESLHLLLEDRLGIELWIPVGLEWWNEGYWQFGMSPWADDRLGRQFLNADNVEVDSSHPERKHRICTLAQARDMTWDYVIASVQENYPGFARFAKQNDAKLVIQIGNVNQYVDWSLDALFLNSTAVPNKGRAVTYHQEMTGFEPSPITNPTRITSLVNLMAGTVCYPLLRDARELLPDFDFRLHGIDQEHGNLKPTSAVAEAMRESGWGWHDKITGDGFGHVIFGLAATGRPLIGHRGHYVGQLGEALWRDGETCIDLDRRTVNEAADMIRRISGTIQHADMGAAIAATFAELVDYEAEAEAVRALLA